MRPPTVAQALVAAVAPATDYEVIAGDLHEEYVRILTTLGATAANRWYWAQALRSIPSLLSYSRSNASALRRIGVAFTAFGALVAMLVFVTAIGMLLRALFGSDSLPVWFWYCIDSGSAVVFGAILAILVRSDGPRVAFGASLFLVACFVVPALAGNPHSQAPLGAWIQLWAVIPAMCIGAGLYQAVKRTA